MTDLREPLPWLGWRVLNKTLKGCIYIGATTKWHALAVLSVVCNEKNGWDFEPNAFKIARVPELDGKLTTNDNWRAHQKIALNHGVIIREGNNLYAFCSSRAARAYIQRRIDRGRNI